MGTYVSFGVYCEKIVSICNTFTSDTPWKESKQLTKDLQTQGYTITSVSTTQVTATKSERFANAPSLHYYNKDDWFDDLQSLYKSNLVHFQDWCTWTFDDRPMTSKDDMRSTLRVWDDLWSTILEDIEEHEREQEKRSEFYRKQEEEVMKNSTYSDTQKNQKIYDIRVSASRHRKRFPYYHMEFVNDVRDTMKKILEYAIEHDGVQINAYIHREY